jgi:hypothetical protein
LNIEVIPEIILTLTLNLLSLVGMKKGVKPLKKLLTSPRPWFVLFWPADREELKNWIITWKAMCCALFFISLFALVLFTLEFFDLLAIIGLRRIQ